MTSENDPSSGASDHTTGAETSAQPTRNKNTEWEPTEAAMTTYDWLKSEHAAAVFAFWVQRRLDTGRTPVVPDDQFNWACHLASKLVATGVNLQTIDPEILSRTFQVQTAHL
jgi:hypothetical protein